MDKHTTIDEALHNFRDFFSQPCEDSTKVLTGFMYPDNNVYGVHLEHGEIPYELSQHRIKVERSELRLVMEWSEKGFSKIQTRNDNSQQLPLETMIDPHFVLTDYRQLFVSPRLDEDIDMQFGYIQFVDYVMQEGLTFEDVYRLSLQNRPYS